MSILTSDGTKLSKMDEMMFQSSVEATSDAMRRLIKRSGDSVAVFVTYAPKDESAKENSFVDLSGIHIQDRVPKPKVSSFPFIYRCGDYFSDPRDIVLFSQINPDKLYKPLMNIKAGLCSMWDLFAEYQTSLDLRYHMTYVVTDVMGYTKAGIYALDPHSLWDVTHPYSPTKDEVFQKALRSIARMHRDAIEGGGIPHYTVR